jgi:hypothetical protein
MSDLVDIELIGPGSYRVTTPHPNGTPTNIIRTEWDGPQGGTRYLWEVSTKDAHGWCIMNDSSPGHTLKEAREHLAAHFEKLATEGQ